MYIVSFVCLWRFLTLQALRGLALLRLGRIEECGHQINEVHQSCPKDDATLQAMSICYREMNRRKCNPHVPANTRSV